MKKLISNYSFNAAAKTVTFSDYGSITLENVLLVTNVTSNTIIYNFAQPTKGGTVAGNVLTLTYNTTSMSNGDKLQIYYDDPTASNNLATGAATSANQTNGTQQSKLTDGTTVASVVAGDAGNNALVIAGSRKEVTFSTTTAQAVAATDVSNYKWVSVHVVTQGGSSSVVFQVSNDGTNWTSQALMATNTATAGPITSTTAAPIMYYGSLNARYFRLNVTGISSGTTAGVIEFSSTAGAHQTLAAIATQNGTWAVGSNSATGAAVPANAFYGGMSDGTNLVGLRTNVGDGSGSTAQLNTGLQIYNGTTYDRTRAANTAAGTTGTGLLGAGVLGFDGTNYQRLKTDSSGVLAVSQSDGAVTGNNITGDTGQNAQLVAGTRKEVAFSTTSVAAVASTDVSNYSYVSVQITSQGSSSSVAFQVSNDNTNWSTTLLLPSNTNGGATSPVTTTGIWYGSVTGRYFRLNVTGISAGTTAGTVEFFAMPKTQHSGNLTSTQSGTWTVGSNTATGSTVPANAFYLGYSSATGNLTGVTSPIADGITSMPTSFPYVWNGTNADRTRSASAAAGTTGTGLVGAGVLGFDGTNYQRLKTDSSGVLAVSGGGGDIVTGDAGQTTGLVAGNRKEVTFSTTTVQAVAATDVSNYRWVSVHVTSQGGSSTVAFQTSNDNTNWATMSLVVTSTTLSTGSTSTTTTGLYHGSLPGRYFRLNVTGIASGTTAGVVEFFSVPAAYQSIGASVTSVSATGSTAPSTAYYIGGLTSAGNLTGIRVADQDNIGSALATGSYVFSGTNEDRVRSATAAAGTTGTGVLAAGMMGYDGSTNYYRAKVDSSGNQYVAAYGTTDTIYSGTTALTPKFATISFNSSGANTAVAAVASKRIRVLSYTLIANAAVNVKFQSSTTSDITGLLYLAANTGASVAYSPVGLFQTVAGEALSINLSGAIAVGGHLVYVEV
jgi:hypothetical protein